MSSHDYPEILSFSAVLSEKFIIIFHLLKIARACSVFMFFVRLGLKTPLRLRVLLHFDKHECGDNGDQPEAFLMST